MNIPTQVRLKLDHMTVGRGSDFEEFLRLGAVLVLHLYSKIEAAIQSKPNRAAPPTMATKKPVQPFTKNPTAPTISQPGALDI